MNQTVEQLRDLLVVARSERDEAGRATAARIKAFGTEDFEGAQLADRWLVLDANVRRLERLIAHEIGAN